MKRVDTPDRLLLNDWGSHYSRGPPQPRQAVTRILNFYASGPVSAAALSYAAGGNHIFFAFAVAQLRYYSADP